MKVTSNEGHLHLWFFEKIHEYSGLTFNYSMKFIMYSCKKCDKLSMNTKNISFGIYIDDIK